MRGGTTQRSPAARGGFRDPEPTCAASPGSGASTPQVCCAYASSDLRAVARKPIRSEVDSERDLTSCTPTARTPPAAFFRRRLAMFRNSPVSVRSLMLSSRLRMRGVRLAYVGVVLLATMTNLEFSPDLNAASYRLLRAFTISLTWRDAIDGLRNAVLFAGLGAVWILTDAGVQARHRVRRAALAGALLSGAIETVQIFSPVRTASIVDVSTDTLGALLGAAILVLAFDQCRRERDAGVRFRVPITMVCAPYLLAALAEALTPLFQSAPIATTGGPLTRFQVTMSLAVPLSWAAVPLWDVCLYVPAGFLAVLLIYGRGWLEESGWVIVSVLGTMAVAAAHVFHGAVGLPVRWEAVATDMLAFVTGTYTAHRWSSSRGRGRPQIDPEWAIVFYVLLLAVWAWRPFHLEFSGEAISADFLTERLIPLRALAERVDVFSAAHTAQQCLLYMPLGALLAARRRLASERWRDLSMAAAVAVVLEAGHLLIAERSFDVTNIILAWAGVLIGWRIVRDTPLLRRDVAVRLWMSTLAVGDPTRQSGQRRTRVGPRQE